MNLSTTEIDAQLRPLLRHWGQQAEKLAAQQFQVDQKGKDDYVTSIDRELDHQLATAFASLFPHDGIVTEENVQSRQAYCQWHQRLWLIDPLDGTEAFIAGSPDYALMVGLLENYSPIAGWIYAPSYDRMFLGGLGWGVFQTRGNYALESLPVKEPASPSAHFCPVVIGFRDHQNFGTTIARQIPNVQLQSTAGSFGLKILEVIYGRAGLYVYLNRRVKLWDTTGPIALAQAAGLVCCDLTGRTLSFQPDDIDLETLTHKQTIVVGWPKYVDALREQIAEAIL
jgi:3'(2'), 5'-bisphosphate nucleotidase